MTLMLHKPDVLISAEDIQSRLDIMGKEINAFYTKDEPVIVLCVLKGAFLFTADLCKRFDFPCQIEFLRLSSYGNAQESSGVVQSIDSFENVLPDLSGRDVLIMEDIIDTGLTAQFLLRNIQKQYQPRSLRIAALLNKAEMRTCDVNIDFYGFVIPNQFVVGYGLDDKGLQRNLPYIGVIRD